VDELQFYPTPRALAEQAWAMFKDRHFTRVLEPSAGNGDLLEPYLRDRPAHVLRSQRGAAVDAVEADPRKLPVLQAKGLRVVGHDFLEFSSVGLYSHVIMNPPFAQGVQHLLHAWEGLYAGEIVCVLNAETLRNPYSRERQHLVRLIERHGRAQYVGQAFAQAERASDVEVALVHLVKRAPADDLAAELLQGLQAEKSADTAGIAEDLGQQLVLPRGFVEDAVLRFNTAVAAAREAARAQAKASYYAGLVGRTLLEMRGESVGVRSAANPEQMAKGVRAALAETHDALKDRAWTSILRSSEVLSRLSAQAQRRLEAQFETVKAREFTTKNIYGFLQGLCEAAGDIQVGMALDIFDSIVCYHENNTVFYMGWKSNGKHRLAGMRIRTTRFILPGFESSAHHRTLGYAGLQRLSDFDKVFAMLDGKREPAVQSLRNLFECPDTFARLRNGSREQSDYFDVRYYPQRGTIHFFARSKSLVDRLNRLVGRHRQWLPPRDEDACADFHRQYEQAEQFDAELRAFAGEAARRANRFGRSALLGQVVHAARQSEGQGLSEAELDGMSQALQATMAAHRLNPVPALEGPTQQPQFLLAA
jgi:hypothetical protein